MSAEQLPSDALFDCPLFGDVRQSVPTSDVPRMEHKRPAPDRLRFGEVDYVRSDIYELMQWQAKINAETVEAQANVIRRLHDIMEARGIVA